MIELKAQINENEVKKLTKKFNNAIAVNNISFKIPNNSTIGLLGPNGCGKTTTMNDLGLIKPSSGEILIDDKNLDSLTRTNYLSKINFASPYIELPKKLTVKENLDVYGRLYGVHDLTKSINDITKNLDLNKFLNKRTGELSSGQKNRVSLAKSLINKPKFLFLDEPTASLDPDIGDFVRKYFENYKSKNQLKILLASHNMDEVERLCDGVMMMKKVKLWMRAL